MTVKVFIIEKGETRELNAIQESERERISEALNRQAMLSLGYVPAKRKSPSEEV